MNNRDRKIVDWLAVIIIASVVLGAAVTIKLNSIANSPQSTIPSGQTLLQATVASFTLPPAPIPTSPFGIASEIFSENGTWFWILTGAIVAFVVLRYVKALTMQEVSQ